MPCLEGLYMRVLILTRLRLGGYSVGRLLLGMRSQAYKHYLEVSTFLIEFYLARMRGNFLICDISTCPAGNLQASREAGTGFPEPNTLHYH
jgi:hypothetical protein